MLSWYFSMQRCPAVWYVVSRSSFVLLPLQLFITQIFLHAKMSSCLEPALKVFLCLVSPSTLMFSYYFPAEPFSCHISEIWIAHSWDGECKYNGRHACLSENMTAFLCGELTNKTSVWEMNKTKNKLCGETTNQAERGANKQNKLWGNNKQNKCWGR